MKFKFMQEVKVVNLPFYENFYGDVLQVRNSGQVHPDADSYLLEYEVIINRRLNISVWFLETDLVAV